MAAYNGLKFTTYDQDFDNLKTGNCAKKRRGAWWYHGCTDSNLNAYYDPFEQKDYSYSLGWDFMNIKFSEIKLRRK